MNENGSRVASSLNVHKILTARGLIFSILDTGDVLYELSLSRRNPISFRCNRSELFNIARALIVIETISRTIY